MTRIEKVGVWRKEDFEYKDEGRREQNSEQEVKQEEREKDNVTSYIWINY